MARVEQQLGSSLAGAVSEQPCGQASGLGPVVALLCRSPQPSCVLRAPAQKLDAALVDALCGDNAAAQSFALTFGSLAVLLSAASGESELDAATAELASQPSQPASSQPQLQAQAQQPACDERAYDLGDVLYSNDAMGQLCGYSRQELARGGLRLLLLPPQTLPPASPVAPGFGGLSLQARVSGSGGAGSSALALVSAMSAGAPGCVEIGAYHASGRRIWCSISLSPLESGACEPGPGPEPGAAAAEGEADAWRRGHGGGGSCCSLGSMEACCADANRNGCRQHGNGPCDSSASGSGGSSGACSDGDRPIIEVERPAAAASTPSADGPARTTVEAAAAAVAATIAAARENGMAHRSAPAAPVGCGAAAGAEAALPQQLSSPQPQAGRRFLAMFTDVTAQKQLALQLQQLQQVTQLQQQLQQDLHQQPTPLPDPADRAAPRLRDAHANGAPARARAPAPAAPDDDDDEDLHRDADGDCGPRTSPAALAAALAHCAGWAEVQGGVEGCAAGLGVLGVALDALREGITIADPAQPDAPIVYANAAFLAMTGYKREEVLGRNCRFLQGPDTDRAAVARIREAISARRGCTVQLVNYSRSGSRFWNELRLAPVLDPVSGRLVAYLGVQHDVTELLARRHSEAKLRNAKEAAECAAEAKSQFLANMSHEIRTPLNGMIATAQLLLASVLTPEQRELAETILESGSTLQGILGDILDFSKIDHGSLELQRSPLCLRLATEACVDLVAAEAAKKGLALAYLAADEALARPLMGDPVRLRQVLANLLSNAVKFTERGEVVVRVTVEPADQCRNPDPDEGEDTPATAAAAAACNARAGSAGGAGAAPPPPGSTASASDRPEMVVHFAVSDTGIGIGEESARKLFQHFRQGSETMSRRYGGTGLGLAISKRLAQLMRGDIWVESTLSAGSTFHFTLAADWAAESDAAAAAAAAAGSGWPWSPPSRSTVSSASASSECTPRTSTEEQRTSGNVAAIAAAALTAAAPRLSNGGAPAPPASTAGSDPAASRSSGVSSGGSGRGGRELRTSPWLADGTPAPDAPATAAAAGGGVSSSPPVAHAGLAASLAASLATPPAPGSVHSVGSAAASGVLGGGADADDVALLQGRTVLVDVSHPATSEQVWNSCRQLGLAAVRDNACAAAAAAAGGAVVPPPRSVTTDGIMPSATTAASRPFTISLPVATLSSIDAIAAGTTAPDDAAGGGGSGGSGSLRSGPGGGGSNSNNAGGRLMAPSALAALAAAAVGAPATPPLTAPAPRIPDDLAPAASAAPSTAAPTAGLATAAGSALAPPAYDILVVSMDRLVPALKAGWKGRPVVVLGDREALPPALQPLVVAAALPLRHSRLAAAMVKATALLRWNGSSAPKLGNAPIPSESIQMLKSWRLKRGNDYAEGVNRRTSLDNSALERAAMARNTAAAAAAAAMAAAAAAAGGAPPPPPPPAAAQGGAGGGQTRCSPARAGATHMPLPASIPENSELPSLPDDAAAVPRMPLAVPPLPTPSMPPPPPVSAGFAPSHPTPGLGYGTFPGGGTPAASAAAASAAAAAQQHSHLAQLRILIAEDNKVNQKVVLKVLQQILRGVQPPDVVENGLQVLAALEKKTYDLILMDIHMPEMDGLEASKRIQEAYKPEERPRIIALSADTVQTLHDRCREAGIEAFLVKPFRIEELARVMRAGPGPRSRRQAAAGAGAAGPGGMEGEPPPVTVA
ncbi:hypothetical protein HYH03_001342 [Edaphochlamys debaryana]|uniref:histidine kinase n=1 Tax=Edaphochlamys debaryana TaxID=47281 RepID=A0A835YF52_9CHLO|nr:hypothetical protein HYH03_001342 [Edaphochlamys debaryana]|eukprot:KAG2500572.1 hypothetical protein HYH03_001342 [Edaphochlamys debaryana]